MTCPHPHHILYANGERLEWCSVCQPVYVPFTDVRTNILFRNSSEVVK